MATFSNGESGFSVRTKINDVLQHMDGTAGTLVVNEAGADVDFRVESDTEVNAFFVDGANGRIGLGTGTPTTNLDVVAGGARWRLSHDGVGNIQQEALNSAGALYSNLTQFANLFVFSTSGTERMRITTAGNVGIGTSSPASLLHVNGTAGGGAIFSQAGYNYATVSQVLSSADAVFGGGVIASSVTQQVSKTTADAAHYMKAQITEGITFHTNITGAAGASVARGTNERMRITAAGDVGIGTASPIARLHTFSGVGTAFSTGDYGASGAIISGASRTGTTLESAAYATTLALVSTTDTTASSTGASLGFVGKWNSSAYSSGAQFASIFGGKENSTDVNLAGYMSFATRAAGGVPTEQMRITSTGNVGIGTASPAYRLHVLSASGFTSAFRASTAATTGILVGNTAGDTSIQTLASGDSLINSDTGKYLAFGTNGATERMRIDSAGNLALGATPNTGGYGRAFEIVHSNFGGALTAQAISADNYPVSLTSNAVTSGPNTWKYMNTASATRYDQVSGQHRWIIAPSGTAGAAISFTQAMTLDASGNLGINTVTPTNRLQTVTTPPAAVPAAGAAGHALAVGTTPYGVASGALNDGRGYIQATRWDGTATNYSLLLQPNGGSVGIGVANPTATLQIGGVAGGDRTFQMGSAGATRGILSTNGTNGTFSIGATNDSAAGALVFQTGGALAERMRINELGDVGIGTASPSSLLHLQAASAPTLRFSQTATSNAFATIFTDANGTVNISADAGNASAGETIFRVFVDNAERARITPTGDLLVGTTAATGAASNAAVVVSGGVRTNSGTLIAVPTATPTTMFSITAANRGRYEVVSVLGSSGSPNDYTAIATVIWDGSGGRIIPNDGAKLALTLSGSNVQVTHTAGVNVNVMWSFQRIAM